MHTEAPQYVVYAHSQMDLKFRYSPLLSLIHTRPPSTSVHYLLLISFPLSGIILIPLFSHLLLIGTQLGKVFNKQPQFSWFLRRLLTHLACHSVMNKQWRSGDLFSVCLCVSSLSPSLCLSLSLSLCFFFCTVLLWTECQDCLKNELSVEGLQRDTSGSLWALENNELFPFLPLICSIRYPWQVQRDKQSPLELIKYTEYIQKSFDSTRVQPKSLWYYNVTICFLSRLEMKTFCVRLLSELSYRCYLVVANVYRQ